MSEEVRKSRQRMIDDTAERKTRRRLYKSGKLWLVAGLTSTAMLFGTIQLNQSTVYASTDSDSAETNNTQTLAKQSSVVLQSSKSDNQASDSEDSASSEASSVNSDEDENSASSATTDNQSSEANSGAQTTDEASSSAANNDEAGTSKEDADEDSTEAETTSEESDKSTDDKSSSQTDSNSDSLDTAQSENNTEASQKDESSENNSSGVVNSDTLSDLATKVGLSTSNFSVVSGQLIVKLSENENLTSQEESVLSDFSDENGLSVQIQRVAAAAATNDQITNVDSSDTTSGLTYITHTTSTGKYTEYKTTDPTKFTKTNHILLGSVGENGASAQLGLYTTNAARINNTYYSYPGAHYVIQNDASSTMTFSVKYTGKDSNGTTLSNFPVMTFSNQTGTLTSGDGYYIEFTAQQDEQMTLMLLYAYKNGGTVTYSLSAGALSTDYTIATTQVPTSAQISIVDQGESESDTSDDSVLDMQQVNSPELIVQYSGGTFADNAFEATNEDTLIPYDINPAF